MHVSIVSLTYQRKLIPLSNVNNEIYQTFYFITIVLSSLTQWWRTFMSPYAITRAHHKWVYSFFRYICECITYSSRYHLCHTWVSIREKKVCLTTYLVFTLYYQPFILIWIPPLPRPRAKHQTPVTSIDFAFTVSKVISSRTILFLGCVHYSNLLKHALILIRTTLLKGL